MDFQNCYTSTITVYSSMFGMSDEGSRFTYNQGSISDSSLRFEFYDFYNAIVTWTGVTMTNVSVSPNFLINGLFYGIAQITLDQCTIRLIFRKNINNFS